MDLKACQEGRSWTGTACCGKMGQTIISNDVVSQPGCTIECDEIKRQKYEERATGR